MNGLFAKDAFDRNVEREEKERKLLLDKYASDITEMYKDYIQQKERTKSDKRNKKRNEKESKSANGNNGDNKKVQCEENLNVEQNKSIEQNVNDKLKINKQNNIMYVENNYMDETQREYYYNKNKSKGTLNRINQLLSINPLSKEIIKDKVVIDPDTERAINTRKTKQKQYKAMLDKQNLDNKNSNYYYRDPNYNPCKFYLIYITLCLTLIVSNRKYKTLESDLTTNPLIPK